jgi:hypothetical protein
MSSHQIYEAEIDLSKQLLESQKQTAEQMAINRHVNDHEQTHKDGDDNDDGGGGGTWHKSSTPTPTIHHNEIVQKSRSTSSKFHSLKKIIDNENEYELMAKNDFNPNTNAYVNNNIDNDAASAAVAAHVVEGDKIMALKNELSKFDTDIPNPNPNIDPSSCPTPSPGPARKTPPPPPPPPLRLPQWQDYLVVARVAITASHKC